MFEKKIPSWYNMHVTRIHTTPLPLGQGTGAARLPVFEEVTTMNMQLLKEKFRKVQGYSLDLIAAKPEKISEFVHADFPRGNRSASAGRGYPFFDHHRISADEKDRQNLEILSQW